MITPEIHPAWCVTLDGDLVVAHPDEAEARQDAEQVSAIPSQPNPELVKAWVVIRPEWFQTVFDTEPAFILKPITEPESIHPEVPAGPAGPRGGHV